MQNGFSNILIIKPSALGDIVQALPALSALRRSFPDAEISWLIRPQFAPLLEGHRDLTGIIPFDRKFLGKMWYHPGALLAFLGLCRRLRRSGFDAVFDFQGLFRTAILTLVSGCKKRLGIAQAREFAPMMYTHKVRQESGCIHVVDLYMKIVRAAGASQLDVRFALPRDPAAEQSVERLLSSGNVKADHYAVLVPGSAHADKCWPVERFAALAETLCRDHDLSIVATGSSCEAPLLSKLAESAQVPVANLAGKTSIPELIALLRSARLVVGNDTGPAHIAAALATPIVMIFGRSNPARVAPYGKKDSIVAIDAETRGFKPNSTDPRHNIRHITLEEVYQKALTRLKLHP